MGYAGTQLLCLSVKLNYGVFGKFWILPNLLCVYKISFVSHIAEICPIMLQTCICNLKWSKLSLFGMTGVSKIAIFYFTLGYDIYIVLYYIFGGCWCSCIVVDHFHGGPCWIIK